MQNPSEKATLLLGIAVVEFSAVEFSAVEFSADPTQTSHSVLNMAVWMAVQVAVWMAVWTAVWVAVPMAVLMAVWVEVAQAERLCRNCLETLCRKSREAFFQTVDGKNIASDLPLAKRRWINNRQRPS